MFTQLMLLTIILRFWKRREFPLCSYIFQLDLVITYLPIPMYFYMDFVCKYFNILIGKEKDNKELEGRCKHCYCLMFHRVNCHFPLNNKLRLIDSWHMNSSWEHITKLGGTQLKSNHVAKLSETVTSSPTFYNLVDLQLAFTLLYVIGFENNILLMKRLSVSLAPSQEIFTQVNGQAESTRQIGCCASSNDKKGQVSQ